MKIENNGYIRKKSSEFRGTDRCQVLRKYDKLNTVLDTVKESNYDEAILIKDILKGYLSGDFVTTEFRGLIEEGLDDGNMLLPEQRHAKVERLYKLLYRAAVSEKRKPEFVKSGKVYEAGYEVLVNPDVVFRDNNSLELVLYRVGKPNVTQNGKKQDGSVKNCLELYFLLKYARTMVPVGETYTIKASYYFMRKTTDTSTGIFDEDFFSGNGGNVVTLEEKYVGGSVEPSELDDIFADQLVEYTYGVEQCSDQVCAYCKMYTQCFWQKNPKQYEKKSLSGKQGKITPSEAQQKVIDFRTGYCKVNAGAGTGKTECMTERGARMFAEGVDPKKMLFITFTDAGAIEMKERLSKKAEARGLDIKPEDIMAMTFNAFDFTIVKENYQELGFKSKPRVIDRVRNSVIITELLEENPVAGLDYLNYNMDHGALLCVLKAFDIIKTEHIDPDDPFATGKLDDFINETGLTRFMTGVSLSQIISLYKKYDEILMEDCLVQFADQEPLANRYIDAHPDYLEERFGFEHIIVDEFQDSNDGQLDKIKRLCACPSFKSLMVVGDDSQAIYSFRHTSPENIIHFFEKMEVDGTELFLTENRRSHEEIIELANKINDLNTEKVAKTMVSTRGTGGKAAVKGFFKKAEEYENISNQIRNLIDSGVQPEDIAFIAFTRDEIIEMSSILSKKGIPWVMKNPLLLMKNSRVNAALSLAMSFYEPDASKCYFDYLVAKYDGDLLDHMTDDEIATSVDILHSEFNAIEDMPFEVQRAIFHQYLEDIKGNDEIYSHFLDLIYDNEDLQSELEYIMNFKRFGEHEEKKMEQSYQGVVLTTAHSSKGLEWKYVFNSISKYDNEYLHGKTKKAIDRKEEMRRLLFVSLTRARDEVFVSGQFIAFGTKEQGYTQNQFLEEVHYLLDETYDPVDHEAERKRLEKEKLKAERKSSRGRKNTSDKQCAS